MPTKLKDNDQILQENEHWSKLEKEWGTPVDLETEEDNASNIRTVYNTLEMKTSTFNSSFILRNVKKNVMKTRKKPIEYKDFVEDLQGDPEKVFEVKQFYYVNGQILSAFSVEQICEDIDNVFRSIEKLCSATSTIRNKKIKRKFKYPDVVQCSISIDDLSFDDTVTSEIVNDEDINICIDEAFEEFNSTLVDVSLEDKTNASVTTLVKKFTSILKSPQVICNPRRKRQCCDRFKELADFWEKMANQG